MPNKSKRPIDDLVKDSYDWWNKSYVFIKKTKVKTLYSVFILAFLTGVAMAIIWSVSSGIHQSSLAATSSEQSKQCNQYLVQAKKFTNLAYNNCQKAKKNNKYEKACNNYTLQAKKHQDAYISKCQKPVCRDSDNGLDYYTKGEVYDKNNKKIPVSDVCAGVNELSERFCGNKGLMETRMYYCENGCQDGVCVKIKPDMVVSRYRYYLIYDDKNQKDALILHVEVSENGVFSGSDDYLDEELRSVKLSVEINNNTKTYSNGVFGGPYLSFEINLEDFGVTIDNSYEIILMADSDNLINESNETNNVTIAAITTDRYLCDDSDGGDDYFTKGYTRSSYSNTATIGEDYCSLSNINPALPEDFRFPVSECNGENCKLTEFSCSLYGSSIAENTTCLNGCRDGACAASSTKPDLSIKDIYIEDSLVKVKYCNDGFYNKGSWAVRDTFYIKVTINGNTHTGTTNNSNYIFEVPETGLCANSDGYPIEYFNLDPGVPFLANATIDWENTVLESNEDNNNFGNTIIVNNQSGNLFISQSAGAPNGVYTQDGVISIELNRINFTANNIEDINVGFITITSNIINPYLQNIKLIDYSTKTIISPVIAVFNANVADFAGLKYVVPRGQTKTISIVADIGLGVPQNTNFTLGITSPTNVNAVGLASGEMVNINGTAIGGTIFVNSF